jgi:hypothetical protein
MCKPTRNRVVLIVLAMIAVAALAGLSPSYTYVSVTGPEGVKVEKAGFGPQRVRVNTEGVSVESSTR